jgi:hypothetical protein
VTGFPVLCQTVLDRTDARARAAAGVSTSKLAEAGSVFELTNLMREARRCPGPAGHYCWARAACSSDAFTTWIWSPICR